VFWKRKPAPPKARAGSGDRELDALAAALAARQERIAQLELDLLNSQTELAAFNAEIEQRLGMLQRRLETLEAELADARHKASRRALWGERASSPDVPEDVITQYQRLWGRDTKTAPSAPSAAPAPARVDEAELKTLYRALAKRFHPDLASDLSEKPWREDMMAKVNDAYRAQDLAALRQLANEHPEPPAPPAPKTRERVLAERQAEIERLDELASKLEQQLEELAKSPAVQLKLEALWARRAGGDLLADMGRQLQAEIGRAEKELAILR
jgi:predicted  nucleic acid-binding Zn-ribbon protein